MEEPSLSFPAELTVLALWLMQQSFEGLRTYMCSASRNASESVIVNLADVLGSAASPATDRIRAVLMIDEDDSA